MDNYELNEDGTVKLDAEGNPVPKVAPKEPTQDSVPAWMVAVNAATVERQRVEQENIELRQRLQQIPASAAPTFEPGALYNDPNPIINEIERRMKLQVEPLQRFQQQFERQQVYNKMKANAKLMIPAIANLFARGIEPLVDQEMANREPTEANFAQVIEMVVGRVGIQNPSFFAPQAPAATPLTPAPVAQPNVSIPPHLRPTSSPNLTLMPQNNLSAAKDPANWDENTRRLWKESGESAEDYYDLTHTEPNDLEKVYRAIQLKKKAGAK